MYRQQPLLVPQVRHRRSHVSHVPELHDPLLHTSRAPGHHVVTNMAANPRPDRGHGDSGPDMTRRRGRFALFGGEDIRVLIKAAVIVGALIVGLMVFGAFIEPVPSEVPDVPVRE